ncbi:MAG: DUF3995 domain-containing protein [Burkholderiales bacterium]
MNMFISIALSAVFVGLAVWHFGMAFLPTSGESGAVPSIDGKPLFVPSTGATVGVGVALLLCAGLIAATPGLVSIGMPARVLRWFCYALSIGLLARAIGDFRYIGFFKHVRGGRFAQLDSFVYSPLCLLLALGVAFVAYADGT